MHLIPLKSNLQCKDVSLGPKEGRMLTLAPKMYGCKGNSMVYLKPLYSRLNRLAQCQSSPFSTEAHVKILLYLIYLYIKKDQDKTILSLNNTQT